MKRIFIFPTIEEAKAFILTEPRDPVFVGGVGMAEIAAATLRAVKAKKPQLVILAGIAGAYDRTLRRGEVVEVVTERVSGIPERYAREYETSGPDLGLPLAAGVTVSRTGDGLAAVSAGNAGGAGDAGAEHAADGKTRSMSADGKTQSMSADGKIRSMSAMAQCTANCGETPRTAGVGAGTAPALDSTDSAQDDANSRLDGGNDGQDGSNCAQDTANGAQDGAKGGLDSASGGLDGANNGLVGASGGLDGGNDSPEVAGADAEVPQQEFPQQSPRQAPRLEENPRQEFPQKENPQDENLPDNSLPEDTLPEVENMEGAAFFAVCEALGVACCQVRAVSNYVGEPFDRWAVEQAVGNLTEKLTQIFGKDE